MSRRMFLGKFFGLWSEGKKKMSVRDTVEDLTQICIAMRQKFGELDDQKEKENIVLKHVKEFASADCQVNDFQKGLEWFNVSEGLSTQKHLAGKITVLDFFTYCCINCMHILPDLEALEKKFSVEDGLVVVGVHSAKFANERESGKILSAVQRYNISHAVVNDAKLSMWRDIGIVCWPSLVILGPKGQPLFVLVGEGRREELFIYVKVALAYFKSLDEILKHSLPLKPAQHLLPASKGVLLFPGKVHSFQTESGEKIAVSDSGNNRILVIDVNGKVEHVIGGCAPAFRDGNFQEAGFNAPQGICTLGDSIFVADNENHAVRKIDLTAKTVTTVAGNGKQGHDYSGGKFGKSQSLSSPWDVAIYSHNETAKTVPVLLIAIAGSHQIWAVFLEDTIWWKKKEYKAGTCVAIVGNGREENRNNSYPHAASLAQPSGLAVAQEIDACFFADSESSSVRRVHLKDGKVTAVCGADRNPANLHSFGDVDGKQFLAKLQHPLGVAWDPAETAVYIADTYNHKIKKTDTAGNCISLYGDGKPNKSCKFDEPSGLSLSPDHKTLYIADTNNHAVKAVNIKDGSVRTIAITMPQEIRSPDEILKFGTEISSEGGDLTISFGVEFVEDLKLNSEAPQRWSFVLPSDSWKTSSLSGSLETPISLTIPKGESRSELHINLDIVACKTEECVPKKLTVVYTVSQKSEAPKSVSVSKVLRIK